MLQQNQAMYKNEAKNEEQRVKQTNVEKNPIRTAEKQAHYYKLTTEIDIT